MTLLLPTQFHEIGQITCKEPISIDVYYIDEQTERAYFRWDFGMEGVVHLKNWILEGKKIEGVQNRILADVIFDIGHAFFHYEGDPNYTSYHWALTGWLRDRIQAEDSQGEDSQDEDSQDEDSQSEKSLNIP